MMKKCSLCGGNKKILLTVKIREQNGNDFVEGSLKPLCLRCLLRSMSDIPTQMRQSIPAMYDEECDA